MTEENINDKLIIHIVTGSQGYYSDYTYWVVCAYLDRDKALEHAALASKEAEDCWNNRFMSSTGSMMMKMYDSVSVWDSSIRYSVEPLFIHENPHAYRYVDEKLTEVARAQGLMREESIDSMYIK